jgi:chromate transporter
MLDEVVERRGWMERAAFLDLMAVTHLLPGPNSSEMAIHVGYTQRGVPGALVTGLAFLLPAFGIVTVLAGIYFGVGAAPTAGVVLAALRPVVVALIVHAGVKLARAAAPTRGLWGLVILGGAVGAWAEAWVVPAMLLGGVSGWVGRSGRGPGSPDRWMSVVSLPFVAATVGMGTLGVIATVFLTHFGLGAILFGGGYVLVALLEPLAVGRFEWLTAAQFLDGVALTQAVPGPISTLAAFVGFAAAGLPGAVAGIVGIYLPAFLAVLLVAPHLERMRANPAMRGALAGVGATAAGTILGVAVRVLPAVVTSVGAAVVFGVALFALVRYRIPAVWLIAMALGVGVVRVVAG